MYLYISALIAMFTKVPSMRFVLKYFPILVLMVSFAVAAAQPDDPVRVQVQKEGDVLWVNSEAVIRATPQEVWAVMTDFDHMARFISNLRSSKVLSVKDNMVAVAQTGRASAGMLSFDFESVREMELKPFTQIRSRQLSGTMASFDGTTVLRQEGDLTRIESRVRAVPSTWVPPVIGKRFIESETREQFQELLAEVVRRQALKP